MAHRVEGHLLCERFELLHRLGRGGVGECWLARDTVLGARVALKILATEIAASPDVADWLRSGLPRVRALSHPRLVRVSEPLDLEGAPGLSMDYFAGGVFGRFRGRSFREILASLAPVLDALSAAHASGLVHGALKAPNLLCDATGAVYLADLGLADLARLARGGPAPVPAADVYALGALLYEWISGRRPFAAGNEPGDAPRVLPPLTPRAPDAEAIPESLERLVARMLAPARADRPDLEEVRSAFGALGIAWQPEAGARVGIGVEADGDDEIEAIRIEPISLETALPRAPAADGAGNRDSLLRRLTLGSFAALLIAAVGVFYFLPRAVERRAERARSVAEGAERPAPPSRLAAQPRRAAPRPALPPVGAAPAELLREAQERKAAEAALASATAKRDELAERGVQVWAADDFTGAGILIDAGVGHMRHEDWRDAEAAFLSARSRLEALEARGVALLAESLRAGGLALSGGRAEEARAHFELALQIEPGNADALHGIERAGRVDEVFARLREAARLEAQGDLEGALAAYTAAGELDPEVESAGIGRERVQNLIREAHFLAAMTEGFASLDAGSLSTAKRAFERAHTLRPEAPGPADGIAQADQGLRLIEIGRLHAQARDLEGEERWSEAAEKYEAALALDPALLFALRGRARAQQLAALSAELESYARDPERLSTREVYDRARQVLERAEAVGDPGPRLRSQIAAARQAVEQAGTTIAIQLESDQLTDVVVYRVGKLGNFDSRRLELRPGTYTAVGTREGYRDVRKRFTLRAGERPEPVVVRCEEKI